MSIITNVLWLLGIAFIGIIAVLIASAVVMQKEASAPKKDGQHNDKDSVRETESLEK
ncbi:hypothetical protein MKY34_05030 [Sporosarcina sp. FSL K6-1522]|uniref:hypothetical protein n=1 Tax=Sporosarcina sp. FSL K6-1522 TaxID=2921554 RepID=UPI00315A6DFE